MLKKPKLHLTKKYARIRIKNPKYFDKKSLRTKDIGRKGFSKLIIGCKRGKFKKGRCTIGTQTQAVLLSRKDFKI